MTVFTRGASLLVLAASLVPASAGAARAASDVARVKVVAPLVGSPSGDGVFTTDLTSQDAVEPNQINFLAPGKPPVVVDVAGQSTSTLQPSFDPLSGDRPVLVWTSCPAAAVRGPRCVLRTSRAMSGTAEAIGDPSGDAADVLPAIYGGSLAFVRRTTGSRPAQLRWLAAGSRSSIPLRSGPAGSGGPSSLVLRAKTLAYVWKSGPESGGLETLKTQTVGAKPKTLLSVARSRATIIGPAWVGSRLLFVIRDDRRSMLYRYAPASGRYERAGVPRDVAAIGVDRRRIYWTLRAGTGVSGRANPFCAPATCRVQSTPRSVLNFRPVRRPAS